MNPKLCQRYVFEKTCSYGEKSNYLHKEKEQSPAELKFKEKNYELEKLGNHQKKKN